MGDYLAQSYGKSILALFSQIGMGANEDLAKFVSLVTICGGLIQHNRVFAKGISSMEWATLTPGQLTIGASDFDARPMTYVEGQQRLGYEPDVARAVCAKLGLQPVWLNLPMAEFYATLQAKSCDIVWFNQAITPARQQHSVFTRPYGLYNEAIIVRANDAIETAADLAGRKMAGLADSTNVELGQQFEGVELIPFPGTDKVLQEMLAALRAGEVDAVVDDELVLITAAEADPTLRIAVTVETRHPFAIALHPDSSALLTVLNQTLDQLEADGTLQQLWERWIPWRPFPFV